MPPRGLWNGPAFSAFKLVSGRVAARTSQMAVSLAHSPTRHSASLPCLSCPPFFFMRASGPVILSAAGAKDLLSVAKDLLCFWHQNQVLRHARVPRASLRMTYRGARL